jgi:hypothetical protein
VNQNELTPLVTGLGTIAAGSGFMTVVMDWLDVHAAGIGAACTLFFGVFYCVIHYLSYRKLTRVDENDAKIIELQHQINGLSDRKSRKTKG